MLKVDYDDDDVDYDELMTIMMLIMMLIMMMPQRVATSTGEG